MPKNTVEVQINATDNASSKIQNFGKALVAAGVLEFGRRALKAGKELAEFGARAERAASVFEAVSGGSEQAAANLEAMQRATRGALSDTEAMAAASQILQMGLVEGADEMGRFAEMAVTLGTAMGRDASQSMEEFALLMANQSIPRLDTFGISAGRVRERMNELADANKNMTREQRFNIAVMEEGGEAMARLGATGGDAMEATAQAGAAFKNFRDELGKNLTPALQTANEAAAQLFGTLADGLKDINNNREAADKLSQTVGGPVEATMRNYGVTLEELNELSAAAEEEILNNASASEIYEAATAQLNDEAWRLGGTEEELITLLKQKAAAQVIASQEAELAAERERLLSEAASDALGTAAIGGDVYRQQAQDFATLSQGAADAAREERELAAAQEEAAAAALEARDAFMDQAAAISELSEVAFVNRQIEELSRQEEAGAISTEQYLAAKDKLLRTSGQLTDAEVRAQQVTEDLTAKLVAGVIGPETYAQALLDVKAASDEQNQSSEEAIGKLNALDEAFGLSGSAARQAAEDADNLAAAIERIPTDRTVRINVEGNIPAGIPQGPPGSTPMMMQHGIDSMFSSPTSFVAGERGPERVIVEPVERRVINNSFYFPPGMERGAQAEARLNFGTALRLAGM